MRSIRLLRWLALALFLAGPAGLLGLAHASAHEPGHGLDDEATPCPVCMASQSPAAVPSFTPAVFGLAPIGAPPLLPLPADRSVDRLPRPPARGPPAS